MMEGSNSYIVPHSEETTRVYKYRWVIITLFGLASVINFAQFMQYTIIADIIKAYYKVDQSTVESTSVTFMVTFIVLFLPVGHIVVKTSLKTTCLLSAGLTAIGTCLKLIALSPDSFWLIIVAQTICAISQIFLLIIPSQIANVWFAANEVSTACAIGLFGTQIGVAVGSIVPTFLVKKSDEKDTVRGGLYSMALYNAIASVVMFVIVMAFFRSKPELPPSKSQTQLNPETTMSSWEAFKSIAKNKDFILVLLSMGINYGLTNTFATVLNDVYSAHFPNEKSDAGLGVVAFLAVILGCCGNVIFGYILDKTHKFKLVSLVVLIICVIVSILLAVAMLNGNKIGTYIALPIYGLFSGSLMVISYEYSIEKTYPIPETLSSITLNVVIYIFAIIFVLIMDVMFTVIGYAAGYTFAIVMMSLGTVAVLFISPELKRRDANLT